MKNGERGMISPLSSVEMTEDHSNKAMFKSPSGATASDVTAAPQTSRRHHHACAARGKTAARNDEKVLVTCNHHDGIPPANTCHRACTAEERTAGHNDENNLVNSGHHEGISSYQYLSSRHRKGGCSAKWDGQKAGC